MLQQDALSRRWRLALGQARTVVYTWTGMA
jgi:hypothetical protein